MPVENWKPIPSYPGYEASDLGRVRSVDRTVKTKNGVRRYSGNILRPGRMLSGHLSVALGKGKSVCVHTAVLAAFVGPRPTGLEGCHNNGNPSDNRLSNLRWDTRSENMQEVARHYGRALSPEQVKAARERYVPFSKTDGAKAIAAEMGVSNTVMSKVISGELYAGIK